MVATISAPAAPSTFTKSLSRVFNLPKKPKNLNGVARSWIGAGFKRGSRNKPRHRHESPMHDNVGELRWGYFQLGEHVTLITRLGVEVGNEVMSKPISFARDQTGFVSSREPKEPCTGAAVSAISSLMDVWRASMDVWRASMRVNCS